MRIIVLSICLIMVLTGCGVEWFPEENLAASVSISTTTLVDAPTGLSYSQTLAASGGTAPYTWTVESGSLPAGLSLSTSGTITGTPTVVTAITAGVAVYPVTVKVTDSANPQATATKSLSIFTPTTGRMYDSTGKVYAEGLSYSSQVLTLTTVKNDDVVQRTIQVNVSNYDAAGTVIAHNISLPSVTVPVGASSAITYTLPTLPLENNWRITSVTIQ